MRVLVTGHLYSGLQPFDLREFGRFARELGVKLIVAIDTTGQAADVCDWARRQGMGVLRPRLDRGKFGESAVRFQRMEAVSMADAVVVLGRDAHNDELLDVARRFRVPVHFRPATKATAATPRRAAAGHPHSARST